MSLRARSAKQSLLRQFAKQKRLAVQAASLFCSRAKELCPALVANEVADHRDADVLSLVGDVCPVEQGEDEDASAAEGDGGDDTNGDRRHNGLHRVELYVWTILLVVHKEHDDGDNGKDITEHCPQFIVAGNIG